MADDDDRCEVCRFAGRTPTGQKECRRFPPSIPHGLLHGNADFPIVFTYQWCGEFRVRTTRYD